MRRKNSCTGGIVRYVERRAAEPRSSNESTPIADSAWLSSGYMVRQKRRKTSCTCDWITKRHIDSRESRTRDRRREELAKQLENETLVTKRDVILELKYLGFSRINRVLSFNKNSITLKDSSKIADEDLAAIESVKETKEGISVKMYDKIQPLIKIGEHLDIFEPEELDPDRPRTVNVNVRVYGAKRDYRFNVSTS